MRFTLIMLVVVVVVFSGCGRKKESMAEKIMEKAMKTASGNKADFDISGNKVRITTEDGDMVIAGGADVELPQDLPDDVPIYKDAGVMQTMSSGDRGFSLILTTPDPVNTVAAFYQAALQEKGWKSEGTVNMPGHWMMTGSKDSASLHVMITSGDEGTTMISITGQPAG